MGRFLTGKARAQQTDRRRIWKLLDNILYHANDGRNYIAPRTMYTDFYTIPLWVAPLGGSPIDYDTRCSSLHDIDCYLHGALFTILTEEELRERGYLRYSEKNVMWVCEDIPQEYLMTRKISKFEANNMLYECMVAANVPLFDRIKIRLAVCLNIGWFWDLLTGKVFDLDLSRIYEEEYWREHVQAK